MAADITAQAVASAAVGAATTFVGAAFGLTMEASACGLLGALLGLTFVREPIGPVRSMIQFAGYGIGGALFATWATTSPAGRTALALLAGFMGNPAARLLWTRADQVMGPTFDRLFGAAKPKGKKP